MKGIVLVGGGLAAATAASTLRQEGFTGRIVLAGEEDERPYERPPLSKEFLQGRSLRETVFVHPAGWYREHDVELRLGSRVTRLDRAAQQVTLADGTAEPLRRRAAGDRVDATATGAAGR